MTTWKRRTIVLVVIAFGVASAACGDSGFAPGAGPTAPGANPPQPPSASVSGVGGTALMTAASGRISTLASYLAG